MEIIDSHNLNYIHKIPFIVIIIIFRFACFVSVRAKNCILVYYVGIYAINIVL